jgi:2',3'-cyclic-nucleotide 2'-phosphodiesterase (5'-nucleotidase family)
MNNINNLNKKSQLKINKRFYVLIILFTLVFANYIYLNKKTVNISILYTSDIQGNIFSIDNNNQVYGLLALPYFLKQYKDFALVDLGNSIYKTPESILNDGMDVAKLMSDVGYDAVNIGASELSWGVNIFASVASNVDFPFISSNLKFLNDGQTVKVLPYTVKEIKGIKIGIIGLIDKESLKLNCPVRMKNFEVLPVFQTLKHYVKFLRENEKVDVIVLLSRFDVYDEKNVQTKGFYKLDNITIANEVPGIDVIISKPKCEGKLCKVYIASDKKNEKNKTIICNTIPKAEYIGKTNLVIRKKSKKIVSFNNELIPAKIDLKILEKDKKFSYFKNLINKKFDAVIGRTNFELKKEDGKISNLGGFITDVMRIRTNSDIAILENKYIFDYIKAGKITNRDIFSIFPNNCGITTLKMKGKDLLKLIERNTYNISDDYLNISGLYYSFDKNLPVYSKVLEIFMENDAEKFSKDKIYKVAIIGYMLNKDDFLYKNAFDLESTNYKIQDILVDYISTYIPIEEKYNNYDEKIKKICKERDAKFVFKRNN